MHTAQFILFKPTGSLMLIQMKCFRYKRAEKTMHCKMEFRVIVIYRTKELINTDFCGQFLAYLTY